ncbi:RNase H domain-containing protein [Trichonephila clavipes]|nr:RNase H domain-containing protein [Trichonephila clavipes]
MQLGSTSAIRCLERSCPQGSVSGPIFWNIIINDLLSKLNNLAYCEIIAFADDILVCSQERNAINIVQFSDKSTEDFPVICYTDGSKIDGRVGFAFVVLRSGVESENFQFRIRDECTVFVAELLCLNFAVKWITEQNSVISEYLICTDSLSSLDSLKCISSSNNIIVEIQMQLKSLRDKNISIDFAFVRGHTGVLGNERADWLAKAATKRKLTLTLIFLNRFTRRSRMKE